MEPLTALLVTAGITGVLYVVCIINFARMGRNMFSEVANPDKFVSMEDSIESFGKGFGIHIISGGLASLASLATIGCFIWFLVDKFGA